MPSLRLLLALVLLLAPGLAQAGDLEDFFPSLISEIQTNFSPRIVIEGGAEPGVFTLIDGASFPGTFDGTQGVANLSDQIGSQAQRNPIGSAIAAFTFEFDSSLNVFTRTTEGLGPLLSERAETTGKGKLNVAFSYAYVDFDVFEGDHLDDLRVSFDDTVPFVVQPDPAGAALDYDVNGTGVGAVQIKVDLMLGSGQVIPFASDGGGGWVDPTTGTASNLFAGVHTTDFISGYIAAPAVDSELDAEIRAQVFSMFFNYGVTDTLDVGLIVPLLDIDLEGQITTRGLLDDMGMPIEERTSKRDDSDFGIGDITARAKMKLFESEWVDAGVRGDVIIPTGDKDDFMGFGSTAFQLTAIFSKSTKWVSPHANGGVLLRTDGSKGHAARWSAGADLNVHQRAALGFDFVGEHNLDHDGLGDNVLGISGGFKINPWRRLVLTGTALVRLNSEGLRADVIPSGTIEYTFF